jgi:hypothetical protein
MFFTVEKSLFSAATFFSAPRRLLSVSGIFRPPARPVPEWVFALLTLSQNRPNRDLPALG